MASIGILGGTGRLGSALGFRFATAGHSVVIGSRSVDAEVSAEGVKAWGVDPKALLVAENRTAAKSDVVVLATPPEATVALVQSLREMLAGKLILSAVNSVTESVALQIAEFLPDSQVATAFNHLPAKVLGQANSTLDADVVVAATDDTFEPARSIVESISGLRALHCGGLEHARAIENFAWSIVGIARNRQLRNPALKFVEDNR